MSETVIRLEQEPREDDDSGQITAITEISRQVGELQAQVSRINDQIDALAKVDVGIIEKVVEVEADVEKVEVEVVEVGHDIVEAISEVAEEVEDMPDENETVEGGDNGTDSNGPTAEQEIQAAETAVPEKPAEQPAEKESDNAPGKEHWFFKTR